MERLTYEGCFCDIASCCEPACYGPCSQRKVWERLKEYEDAEEKGLLVWLLCKVGDTVWSKECEPYKVISIEWYSRKVTHLHCVSLVTGTHHSCSVGKRSLGKTIFLTREEAEASLRREET